MSSVKSLSEVGTLNVGTSFQKNGIHGELFPSDEEFDDTRIETPKIVRSQLLNNSYSILNSDNITSVSDRPYVLRNTTTLIPLKDHGNNMKQTVAASNENPKYRSRNGTPLRNPPIIFNNIEDEHFTSNTTRSDAELISPNNKLNPAQYQSVNVAFMQDIRYSSPTRKGSLTRKSTFSSPPASLKIKPLSFAPSPFKEDENKISENNESEEVMINSTEKEVNDELIKILSEESKFGTRKESLTEDKVEKNIAQDVTIQATPKNSKAYNPQRDIDSFDGTARENEDISRANLLEKVNQTLDSINYESKRTFSPIVLTNRSPRKSLTAFNVEDMSEASGSDSEEIINKLDFYHSRPERILDISTPLNGGAGNTSKSSIIGDYNLNEPMPPGRLNLAENQQIKDHVMEGNPNQMKAPSEVKYAEASMQGIEYDEWSADKWSKLNRLLRLKTLTRYDLISSDVVVEELGCRSKVDLIKRIDFLQALNNVRKLKINESAKRIRRSQKRKHNPKNRISKQKRKLL